jgi:hypothetical protein
MCLSREASGDDLGDDQDDNRAEEGDDGLLDKGIADIELDIQQVGEEPADHRTDQGSSGAAGRMMRKRQSVARRNAPKPKR